MFNRSFTCAELRLPVAVIGAIMILSSLTWSQTTTGTITGRVTDQKGSALPGVNVVIDGTTLGGASDKNGSIVIAGVPPGIYQLVATMVGYERKTIDDIRVRVGEETRFTAALKESVIPLGEVQVIGNQWRQAPGDMRTSLLNLEPRSAKILPGFGEDVLRSLQALPGVVSPSDFSAQLVVRGSGPDQNLIVMDGIEVFNPYRLYGLISMFNPETVADITLLSGGFPARYGDRLSAVLDVTNKDGERKRSLAGSFNASISNANIVAEGRAPFGLNGSYLLSARRTYYDLIIGPFAKSAGLVANDVAFPNFSDLQAKIVVGPMDGHQIIITGLKSRDGVDIVSGANRQTPDSVDVFNETNHEVIGTAWHFTPTSDFFSRLSLSYYRNDGYSDFGGSFLDPVLDRERFQGSDADTAGIRLFTISAQSRYIFRKYAIREEVTFKQGSHTFEAGIGADFLRTLLVWDLELDPTLRSIIGSRGRTVIDQLEEDRDYYRLNFYVQDRIRLSSRLYLQPGVRLDYYDVLQKWTIAPRVNLSYAMDDITTLRAAYGEFYQSPGYEKIVDQQRSSFRELDEKYSVKLEAEHSTHYVLGIERWLSSNVQLKVESYFKSFQNLIIPEVVNGSRYVTALKPGMNPHQRESWSSPVVVREDSITSIPVNAASGNAYGIELFLEKRRTSTSTKLHGWISYALAWTNRLEYDRWFPFDYDQRHTVNIVGNCSVLPWLDLGFHWRYGSNFPYTPAVGVKPRIVQVERDGNLEPVIQTDILGNVIFDIDRGGLEDRNARRRPAYHRLDLRATAHAEFWGLDWSFYLDIINVYNRTNVLSYQYFIKDDLTLGVRTTSMFPILPTIGVSFRF